MLRSPLYKNKVKESTGDEALTESLYTVLRNELFANLPHTIKFVSPDAASQLAANLPALVSLNKDNLWIKYGDEGLASFFAEFKANTDESPGLAGFLS